MLVKKKRTCRNYYKNSRAQRRSRAIRRCVFTVKVFLLLTAMVGTSLLFILVHDALTQNAYFQTRAITVDGNQRLSRETIVQLAGLGVNDNILAVNLKTVLSRLLADPWVAAAEVERELPDAIHIQIRERVPIAMLDLGRRFYLDSGGEIFKRVEASDKIGVPVVTGLNLSDVDLNDPWRRKPFRDVMHVLRLSRLDGTVLPLHILERVHVDREMGLTLFAFDEGLAIKLGFGGYESKYNRLRDMMSHFRPPGQLSNIKSIDLNDLDRVVVRPFRGVSLVAAPYRKEISRCGRTRNL